MIVLSSSWEADPKILRFPLSSTLVLPGAARFLSDGRRLLVVTEEDDIWLVDLSSKANKKLMTVQPDSTSVHLSVSRDDRWIFYNRITNDGDVWLAELE
ncbi:MAG: hypothetical protein JRI23_14655 [Deltaproteobacteria bacterium]|nr:hypothetical protein [Deltaproteobacteria bacterium]MBW2532990.1 hypothetical protein [Deltaproteobacteria bacterium]